MSGVRTPQRPPFFTSALNPQIFIFSIFIYLLR
jgi:hypothetical protein